MADSYSPPEGVRAEARRALKWIEEGHAGGGFTDTGRKRASDLARGASVSLKTVKRMNSFLARHEVDKQGKGFSQGSDGYPSAGRVSWAAWGGDAGKSWAAKILASVEKSVDAIASDPMQMDLDLATGWAEGEIAWDELPQNVKDAIDEVMAEEFSEEVEDSVGVVVKADEHTELLHKADSELGTSRIVMTLMVSGRMLTSCRKRCGSMCGRVTVTSGCNTIGTLLLVSGWRRCRFLCL